MMARSETTFDEGLGGLEDVVDDKFPATESVAGYNWYRLELK